MGFSISFFTNDLEREKKNLNHCFISAANKQNSIKLMEFL